MWQQWWEPWFGLALIILWVAVTGWEVQRVRHELRPYRVLPEFPEKPAVVRGVRTRLLTAAALWWLPGTVVVVLLALQAPYWATAFWVLLALQLSYWLLFPYLPLRWVEDDSLKRRELYRTNAGHVDWSAPGRGRDARARAVAVEDAPPGAGGGRGRRLHLGDRGPGPALGPPSHRLPLGAPP